METPSRRPFLLAAAVAAVVTVIVWAHLGIHSPQPQHPAGSEYSEHADRLRLTVFLLDGEWAHPLRFLQAADSAYPPGTYVVGIALGLIFGHGAERIMWAWMGWVVLLGLSMAWIVRSLGGSRAARAAAFASAFLIPAIPASASRYYYDLPMLVLIWLAFAVALGTWNKPELRGRLVGGACTGLAVLGACLMKWTALPFLASMLAGAALALPQGDESWKQAVRRRLPAVGATLLAAALLVGAFLDLTDRSLSSMSETFVPGQGPGDADTILGYSLLPLQRALSQISVQLPMLHWWLVYYGLSAVFAVFSPLIALAVLVLGGRWMAVDRRGLVALGASLAGGLGFLTLMVPMADARFLLPLAPVPALAAVLGWSTLGPPTRRVVGVITATVALLVTVDFHLLVWPNALSPNATGQPNNVLNMHLNLNAGVVDHRGVGLASSTAERGWVRRDEAASHRNGFRDALWDTWIACSPGLPAAECMPGQTPPCAPLPILGVTPGLIGWGSDYNWWSYRATLEDLNGAAPFRWPNPGVVCDGADTAGSAQPLLFVQADGPDDRQIPECAIERDPGWRWEGFVPDPDGGPGAAVFLAPGVPGCLGR